jgi:ABC-type transporter MlaC component
MLAALVILLIAWAGPAAASPEPAAPVLRVHDALIAAADAGWPPPSRILEPLIAQNFDLDAITRTVLGRRDDNASSMQRERLSRALGRRMLREIMHQRPSSRDDGFAVTDIRAIGSEEWLVTTHVQPAGASMLALIWRIRNRSGEPRIIDVLRNGASAVITQHDEIVAALHQTDLDGVIAEIERRADLAN